MARRSWFTTSWPMASAPARRARPSTAQLRCGRPPCRGRRHARSSSFVLRSLSKKNLASARRGRTTRVRCLRCMRPRWSVGRADVADDEEACSSACPLAFEQRKVLLVRLHRQDEAFTAARRGIADSKLAGEHVRPLDQGRSPRRAARRRRSASGLPWPQRRRCCSWRTIGTLRRSWNEADHARPGSQQLLRVAGRHGWSSSTGSTLRLEAMAAASVRPAARPSAVHRHHLGVTMQRDETVRRPHEVTRWSSRRPADSS